MRTPTAWFGLIGLLATPVTAGATETKIGTHTLTLPEGFEIQLIAGPPLIDRPVVADFDERGRLYVAEAVGPNDRMDVISKTRPNRIVRLEDSDGDGRFDQRTIFADKLTFPEGAMWFDGALYVASPPEIWKLEDTNDDGVADRRTAWVKDFPLTGCGNDLHGPYLGPDGRMYFTKGGFGPLKVEREGRVIVDDKAAHIFRARPDGTEFESIIGAGMDNPIDVTHTAQGEAIFTCTFYTNPQGGLRDALVHAVWGGAYGKVHAVMEGLPRTGELLPALTHLGPAAPSGLHRYTNTTLGPGFRDNLFSTHFNMRRVQRHVLTPEGGTFKSRDEDFLVSDNPDFHATDVLEDADGSLIVIDTGGWYGLCCPTSQIAKPQILGGIYRIRRKGAAAIDDPRGARLPWATLAPSALVALLDDRRPFVQRRAIETFAKTGARAVPELAAAVKSSPTETARRNAVWALNRIDGEPARAAVRTGLGDADPSVRQTAIQSIGLHRDPKATAALVKRLSDGSAHERRGAAQALGRMKSTSSVSQLLAAAATTRDRVTEHAIIYALIEVGDIPATRRGLKAKTPGEQRAALLALDELGRRVPGPKGETAKALAPETVAQLLISPDALVRETASFIAGRHKDWADVLIRVYQPWLRTPVLSAAQKDELRLRVATLAESPVVQKIVTAALHDPSTPTATRAVLLQALAEAPMKAMPREWIDEVARALSAGDEPVLRQAVATARTLAQSSTDNGLRAPLLAVARNAGRAPDLRMAALSALPQGSDTTDGLVFSFLVDSLKEDRPALHRAAAADALGRARLDDKQLLALADAAVNAGAMELPRLLVAYDKQQNEALGAKLVAALDRARSLKSLHVATLRKTLAKFPASVQTKIDGLARKIEADLAEQKLRMNQLATYLKNGDKMRGSAVFNGQKAACAGCHQIGYKGGRVGPDLTKIGRIRTETDLLEAIVFPSASFARGFEPFVVVTHDGNATAGVIIEETRDNVRLAANATTEIRIPRADIKEIVPETVSTMPSGFDQVVTPQELADLIAFLRSLK